MSWEDVPHRDPVQMLQDDPTWQLAAEHGIDLCALWLLRLNAVASTSITPTPTTTLIHSRAGEPDVVVRRPRTADEQAEVDSDANDFLVEVGLPPRPGGRMWWFRVPRGVELDQARRHWWSFVYSNAAPDDGPLGELRALERLFASAGPWPTSDD